MSSPRRQMCRRRHSPDNWRLALSFVTQTQIWDVADSRTLADASPPFGGSMWLSFSGDSRWVASADNDGHVRGYDAKPNRSSQVGMSALPRGQIRIAPG